MRGTLFGRFTSMPVRGVSSLKSLSREVSDVYPKLDRATVYETLVQRVVGFELEQQDFPYSFHPIGVHVHVQRRAKHLVSKDS